MMKEFPKVRMRRLRRKDGLREMVSETCLHASDLIMPYFVRTGEGERRPIQSMPGQFQFSIDALEEEVGSAISWGLKSLILFGIPREKDPIGKDSMSDLGVIQEALRRLRKSFPELVLIADACFCEYTDHGHCGVLGGEDGKEVDNDATLENLKKQALCQARAGADVIAPSGMMDGMVQAIRMGLDEGGFSQIPIMSYAVKYSSSFYGPFRDAAESPPAFGDRRSYQMDPRNAREAMREVDLDIEEGADIVMVKPALPYLDILRRVRERVNCPVAAYQVSGEYSMLCAAFERNMLDERKCVMETLHSIRRAGADLILSYFTPRVLKWLKEG